MTVRIIVTFFIVCSISIIKAQIQRHDKTFKSLKIGNQVWMSDNLNTEVFRNGDTVPEAKSAEEWKSASENGLPVCCYYEFKKKNAKKYGRLYNWYSDVW
jgi:uncharacterized protein (TIGR02145 family)